MAAKKSKSIPIIMIILLAVFLVQVLLDVVSDFNVHYRYQQTQCRILSHKLTKKRRNKYGLLIELEFAANNQQYRVDALPSRIYGRKMKGPTAQRFIVAYPIGSEVPCWYYPGNPTGTVVLEQGYHTGSIAFWVGFILFAALYLPSYYLTKVRNTRPRGMMDRSGLFKVYKTLLTIEYYYIGDKPATKDMIPPEFQYQKSIAIKLMGYLNKESGKIMQQSIDDYVEKQLQQLNDAKVIITIKPVVKYLLTPVFFVLWCMIMYGAVSVGLNARG